MALIYADGFDSYPTAARPNVAGRFVGGSTAATFSTISAGNGRWGGAAMSETSNGTASATINTLTLPATFSSIRFGFWMKCTALPPIDLPTAPILSFGSTALLNQPGICVGFQGGIFFTNGGVRVGGITKSIFNEYHWVELDVQPSTISIYVDYVLESTTSASLIPGTGIQLVNIGCPTAAGSNNVSFYMDDLVIWDSSGSNFNTFPIGPQRIQSLNPTSAGDKTLWTPSAGANWSVANQPYASAATLTTTVTGNADLYQFSDMSYVPRVINAAVANLFCQDDGSGTKIKASQKLAGVETPSASVNSPTSLRNIQVPLYRDASGNLFTAANVNASQFGMQADI